MATTDTASSSSRSPRFAAAGALMWWVFVCYGASAIGALGTRNAPVFYAGLDLPGWAPPAWVFGPVWTVLYAMMAVSAWRMWRRRPFDGSGFSFGLFGLQLAVNSLWSWVFFAWRQGMWSVVTIVVLWALVFTVQWRFRRVDATAANLLLPYQAWLTFAAALAWVSWQRNPGML
ncbi:MAG: tryptophan-rich sensory protein [Gemmatimonadaceae bacterium]|jgi:translocator protein|nr:tryptophan-rich sensory protein [Gemmatimonadaceae bacterium]MBX9855438.1 tryptophan-rich sensory protein [Gemmatimonadaceae bacterium]